jgi:hypothetical protein
MNHENVTTKPLAHILVVVDEADVTTIIENRLEGD